MTASVGSPWLSVVMPMHEGSRWVAEAIASLVSEIGDSKDVEVIVVDDGSTDDGPAQVAALAKQFHWLTLVGPVRRGSWTATTNHGLRLARAEWATVLHQDDVWLKGHLEVVQRLCSADRDVVIGGATFINGQGRPCGSWTPPVSDGCADRLRIARSLYVQNWVSVPTVTFRRDLVLQQGGFDEDLWYTPDWDLWLKLVSAGRPVVTRRRISGFRLHSGSQTITGSADSEDFLHQQLLVQQRHRECAGDERIARAGMYSSQVNVALAGARQGGGLRAVVDLMRKAVSAGPCAVLVFLNNSRIGQRSLSRLRAGLRR